MLFLSQVTGIPMVLSKHVFSFFRPLSPGDEGCMLNNLLIEFSRLMMDGDDA